MLLASRALQSRDPTGYALGDWTLVEIETPSVRIPALLPAADNSGYKIQPHELGYVDAYIICTEYVFLCDLH